MKTKGFTLIELLVVIAIVAILAAILFPVLANARERGRAAACLSNLKQLGIAFQLYNDEWELNAVEAYSPREWPKRLSPYTKAPSIFACPSNPWSDAWGDFLRAKPSGGSSPAQLSLTHPNLCPPGLQVPYPCGMTQTGSSGSSFFSQPGHPLTLSYGHTWLADFPDEVLEEIDRNPSQAIRLGETRIPISSHLYVTPTFAAEEADFKLTIGGQAPFPPFPAHGRLIHAHRGRTNWLFYDGRVRSLTVRQTLTPANMWTTRDVDQWAYDQLSEHLAPEYR